ncbi:hypothetical protein HDV64DRAFT_6153 [Trichoderma sp. TUCIM 5745]
MLHGSLLEQCKLAGCNGDYDVFCFFLWFSCLYYYTPPILARVTVALAFGSYRTFVLCLGLLLALVSKASCMTTHTWH